MIDLAFELTAGRGQIPLDYGYSLFSALSRLVPRLHGDIRVGVHPIRGVRREPRLLTLVPSSKLRLRLFPEDLVSYIGLAGAKLDLDGFELQVGIPRVEPLQPAASLRARLVTIKGSLEANGFAITAARQLSEIGVAHGTDPATGATLGEFQRRVFRIKGRRMIGFSLRIDGLSAEDSIRLQERGLGGRRRMGCGVFVPLDRRSWGTDSETTGPGGGKIDV